MNRQSPRDVPRVSQQAITRRDLLRTGAGVAVLSAAALSGVEIFGPKVAHGTTTWSLSVPRTDEVTTSWHGTNSKFLDIHNCNGTAVTVLLMTGSSTYGKVAFSTPRSDCGANPGTRKIVDFTLYTDAGTTVATGLAQHIDPATWTAGVQYSCPVTVGYIVNSGGTSGDCWTGPHVHFGADMTTSGSFSANDTCGYGQTVTYDSDYPWSKDI